MLDTTNNLPIDAPYGYQTSDPTKVIPAAPAPATCRNGCAVSIPLPGSRDAQLWEALSKLAAQRSAERSDAGYRSGWDGYGLNGLADV